MSIILFRQVFAGLNSLHGRCFLSRAMNMPGESAVDRLYFSTWSPTLFPFTKPFDPDSIMASLEIRAEWTENGFSMGRNRMISAGDREFVSRLYGYADS